MIDFRSPPAVRPSERDHEADVKAAAAELHWSERMALRVMSDERIARDFPLLAAALDDAVRTDETLRRARRAPCPEAP